MKQFYRVLFIAAWVNVLFSITAAAQEEEGPTLRDSLKYKACPTLYAGINLGGNNPNGWAGASVMYPLVNHVSGKSGAGWGLWGYQVSQEVIAYAGPCNSQAGIGVGLAYNIGNRTIRAEGKIIDYSNGQPVTITEQYSYKTYPIWLANVNVYYFFNTGKRKNRLFVNGGAAFRLTEFKYDKTSGPARSVLGETPDLATSFVSGLSLGIGYFLNVSKYPKRL